MNPQLIVGILVGYFGLLMIIARITSKGADNASFFTGNRKSPWYLVSYGMIGASLSGVTFISIPGWVGSTGFSYMQMVFGYLVGYAVIAFILLPLYYRFAYTSIYSFLKDKMGFYAHKTGAGFFLLSRVIGASFRLFLVASVFDKFVFSTWGIPFWLTTAITILFIWLYSYRGGIKTIVWTDTLQTTFMLAAVVLSIGLIIKEMNWTFSNAFDQLNVNPLSDVFVWDSAKPNYFFKHFISGAFITIVMTGLDQDMMQKNLSCKNLKEAQKNMLWMSATLVPINLLFLSLGALLYLYAQNSGTLVDFQMGAEELNILNSTGVTETIGTDLLFPHLAINVLGPAVAICFILGLVAAAYSSADSALTSLTTSFCVDFLGITENDKVQNQRFLVHVAFSIILFTVIILFKAINSDSVIKELYTAAGLTYGPLLGLFSFSLLSKKKLNHWLVTAVCIASPVLILIGKSTVEELLGFKFGFELLIVNGMMTLSGLFILQLFQGKRISF